MKKTQVALAALALMASATALAEVKVSGIIDMGIGNYTGRGTYMEQGGWADHSSITFAGSEDMGGGLKAFFTLEAGFSQNGEVANGGNGNLFSRQTLVGVSSDQLGSLSLGQQLSPYILAQALTNQGVGNFWVNRVIMGGGFQNAAVVGTNGGFFLKNAVQYTSPNVAGWQLYAMTTMKNGADNSASNGGDNGVLNPQNSLDKYTSLALNGSVAGANLWLSTQDGKDQFRSWTLGATYPLTDELNISANYINHKDKINDVTVKSYAVGASYKIAPAISLVGQYARNNLDDAQSLYNIGASYALSKRTSAYVTYVRATNGAISSLADRGSYSSLGGDSNRNIVVGMTHSF